MTGPTHRWIAQIALAVVIPGTVTWVVAPVALAQSPATDGAVAAPEQTFLYFLFGGGGVIGVACTGSIQTLDSGAGLPYTYEGNDYCVPHLVTCPPGDTRGPGDYLVDFTVENPSSASRAFNVTLSDPNGWLVGAYATRTNVSAEEFGEGSFDKGVTLTIPLRWSTPFETRQEIVVDLRSLSSDGGAFLNISNRLYPTVRDFDRRRLERSWGDFWQ